MAKNSFKDELQQKAARAILVRSIYRWESAAIIALTLILLFLILVLMLFFLKFLLKVLRIEEKLK